MFKYLLILFFSLNLFPSVEGIVLDQFGKPISNLKIELKEKNLITKTDENGKFKFEIEAGKYEIIILGQKYQLNFRNSPVEIFIRTFEEEVIIEPPGTVLSHFPENIMQIPSSSISEMLVFGPNIQLNGLGGAFQTISIGGMAKQRIQIEVMGYKIEGLRRAGTDFGTFHPDLFRGLNLYEMGIGFTHGSKAMGGTIDFELPSFYENKIETNFAYGTNNKSKSVSLNYGSENYLIFSGYQDANLYWDGDGEKQTGYFKRANLYGSYKIRGDQGTTFLDILLTNGWDIGKPFLSSDKTEYPENNFHLIGLRGNHKNINYQIGTYYQDLETTTSQERSFFKSINIQGKLFYAKGNYSFGFETNSFPEFYANNQFSSAHSEPLKNAYKIDTSIFSSYEKSFSPSLKFFSGLRINYFKAGDSNSQKDDLMPGIFLKISREGNLCYDLSLYNIYRFPSIEELFYSGLTARGYVQGNEKLKPEKGYGISFQLKKNFKEREVGISFSYKDAKNYIERYKISSKLYSYKNTDEVEIFSGSLFAQSKYYFANLSYSNGENKKTGSSIDDLKPLSLNFGFIKKINNFQPFLLFTLSDELKDPGPNELERESYFVLSTGINYYYNDFIFSIKGENLFDKSYIPQGDEKAVPQMGRNFLLSINYKK